MRIFFQIGEIYFSLLVLGIYLETITIFITGANIIYIHPLLILIFWMPFLNFISIFPIVIQFWEAIKLRYLKKNVHYVVDLVIMEKKMFVNLFLILFS
jgi:hypothetical protein